MEDELNVFNQDCCMNCIHAINIYKCSFEMLCENDNRWHSYFYKCNSYVKVEKEVSASNGM